MSETQHDLWFCQIRGLEMGPLSSQQLLELARCGELTPADLVRRNTGQEWVLASKVNGLKFAVLPPGPSATIQKPPAHSSVPSAAPGRISGVLQAPTAPPIQYPSSAIPRQAEPVGRPRQWLFMAMGAAHEVKLRTKQVFQKMGVLSYAVSAASALGAFILAAIIFSHNRHPEPQAGDGQDLAGQWQPVSPAEQNTPVAAPSISPPVAAGAVPASPAVADPKGGATFEYWKAMNGYIAEWGSSISKNPNDVATASAACIKLADNLDSLPAVDVDQEVMDVVAEGGRVFRDKGDFMRYLNGPYQLESFARGMGYGRGVEGDPFGPFKNAEQYNSQLQHRFEVWDKHFKEVQIILTRRYNRTFPSPTLP